MKDFNISKILLRPLSSYELLQNLGLPVCVKLFTCPFILMSSRWLIASCSSLILIYLFSWFSGICLDIAVTKYEHWSSLAPLPFEIVISAGQKAKEEFSQKG